VHYSEPPEKLLNKGENRNLSSIFFAFSLKNVYILPARRIKLHTTEKQNKIYTLQTILTPSNFHLQNNEDWETLVEHIEVHKYFVNEKISWTISWEDALFSWYENVFTPIMYILSHRQVLKAFPDKTAGELFFDISNHWYYMQNEDNQVYYLDAAYDYLTKYGKGLSKFLALLSLRAVTY
jgi:hypothetical protein